MKRYKTKDQKNGAVVSLLKDGQPVEAAPVVEGEALTIELKAKRVVTRYTVSYKGQLYDSPRKALDAAGLTGYKGSQIRTVLAGKPVGTKVVVEGHEFIYQGAPVK